MSAGPNSVAIICLLDFDIWQVTAESNNLNHSIKAGLQEKQIETRTCVVVSGPVVDAILQTAEEENADLIAMSSHGRSGVSRLFYGSVAVGLLHRIDRPLLLIRSRKAE